MLLTQRLKLLLHLAELSEVLDGRLLLWHRGLHAKVQLRSSQLRRLLHMLQRLLLMTQVVSWRSCLLLLLHVLLRLLMVQ